MRVVLTVVDEATGRATDVLVDAPAATPMRTLMEALSRRVGSVPPQADVAGGDVPFDESGLVDGDVLHIGTPTPSPPRPGIVDLCVVAGRGSGRQIRLGAGSVRVTLDPSDGLRLDVDASTDDALEVRVGFDASVAVRRPGPARDPEHPVPAERAARADGAPGGGPGGTAGSSGDSAAVGGATPVADVDGTEVGGAWVPWPASAVLRAGELALRAQPAAIVEQDLVRTPDSGQLEYNRPPRLLPPLLPTTFRIPGTPTPPQRSAMPWLMVFVPAVFGVVMATVSHSPLYLLFAASTPLMVIGQNVSAKRAGRTTHRRRVVEHAARTATIEEAIARAVDAERDRRRSRAPDAAALRTTATTPGRRLWERRPTDGDHLSVRIGMGDEPSEVAVQDDRQDDALDVEPRQLVGVPITVPLAEAGVVGVAGPDGSARGLGRWMLGQLAVTQSPREVQFVVLTTPGAMPLWAWTRWLPHARPDGGPDALALIGADAETVGRRLAELGQVLSDRRGERDRTGSARRRFSPEIVVVFDGARRLRALPGVVALLRDGPSCGIRFVCLDEEEWQLPEECTATVVHRSPTQLVLRRQMAAPVDPVLADLVEDDWFDEVARALAPLRDTSGADGDGLVPDSARLLDVVQMPEPTAAAVQERWRGQASTTEAVVGIGMDGPFTLDLVRDGPHGLVAGTTGSGKSEFLQTLVASLALVNRPDRLTFVLVDYKGGAAFSVASDLPHTVGLVTDLDQHLVERALRSLRTELTRREHVLAASGAKDVEDHEAHLRRGGAGAPLPRLVIVIDEFAAMVTELPDFVAGLIGIAQRGRSLGVHLVLATQRPGGVVGPDIRANTNLRVALRMTDPAESSDVIDVGDAARIPKTVPGRAYARLGHAFVVPFQAARVGGRWTGAGDQGETAAPFVSVLADWRDFASGAPECPASSSEESAATDLSMLVRAMREARDHLGIGPLHSPWLPPLPELLPLDTLLAHDDGSAGTADEAPGSTRFPWGLEDLPDVQRQRPATIDLEHFGHRYVVGAPGSGRSQALRTLAASAAGAVSSADLHLYAIDCGNGALASLQALPHCGAVVQRTQADRASRLIERLGRELARRHDVIAAAHAADISEQRRRAAPADRLPHVLVLIDRWEAFVATLGEVEGGALVDGVQSMLRDGAAAGVHVVIAGDRSLLASRMSTLTDDKVLLRLTDRLDYALGGVDHRQLPATIPPGRAFRAESGAEVQIAALGDDVSGQGQTAAVQALAATLRQRVPAPPAPRPFRVDALPEDIDLDAALLLEGAPRLRPLLAVTGIGGDDMALQTVDLATGGGTFLVAGPSRSGRSTMLAAMARSLLAGGTDVVVLAPRRSALRDLAGAPGVRAVLTGDEVTEDDLRPVLAPDAGPVVLVVDDGEHLVDCAAEGFLRDYVRSAADNGQGLVLGGNTTGLAAGFAGWHADVRENRRGALLSPQDTLAGDLVGVRLARSAVSSRVVPGTAIVHLGTGATTVLRVPNVTAATRTGTAPEGDAPEDAPATGAARTA